MLLRLTGWALRLFLVNFTNRFLIQADVLTSGHMPSDFDSPQRLFENLALRELVEALQAENFQTILSRAGGTSGHRSRMHLCLRRRTAARRQNVSHLRGLGTRKYDRRLRDPDLRYTLRNGAKRRGRSLSGWPPTTLAEDQVVRHWGVVSYAGVPS